MNFYDKLLTVDSAILKTEMTPEEFKELVQSKFGLKKNSIKNTFSFGGNSKYSGEITEKTFKVTQGNPVDPGFFFFTRIIGFYYKEKSGTKIEIKVQYGDFIYYGFIPSTIIWILIAYLSTWILLIEAALFIGFIGFYGKTQIQNDYDKFRSDLSHYTKTQLQE